VPSIYKGSSQSAIRSSCVWCPFSEPYPITSTVGQSVPFDTAKTLRKPQRDLGEVKHCVSCKSFSVFPAPNSGKATSSHGQLTLAVSQSWCVSSWETSRASQQNEGERRTNWRKCLSAYGTHSVQGLTPEENKPSASPSNLNSCYDSAPHIRPPQPQPPAPPLMSLNGVIDLIQKLHSPLLTPAHWITWTRFSRNPPVPRFLRL